MSVKEELHHLVNKLTDDDAEMALAYLRDLSRGIADGPRRRQPQAMSGAAFFNSPSKSLEELSLQQGVKPVANFTDLLGDFWPEDESAEEFIATLKEWRSEGSLG